MKRRIIKTGVIIVTLVFALINVLAYNHAGCLMEFSESGQLTKQMKHLSFIERINVLFNGVCIPRPTNRISPDQMGLPFQEYTIPGNSEHGLTLHGWLIPSENSSKLALLYHGYCDTKSSQMGPATVLHKAGWNVALVDFRGSGGSEGHCTSIGYFESEDVRTSYDYFVTQLQPEKTLVLGHSMGAAAVLKALDEGMAQPDLLVIEGVFDTMLNTTKNRFSGMKIPAFPMAEMLVFWGGVRAGFNGFSLNPVEYATSVTCPTLFLHGSQDKRARVSDARKVAAAVAGPVEFVEFPDAVHELYFRRFPEEWTQHILTFAQK